MVPPQGSREQQKIKGEGLGRLKPDAKFMHAVLVQNNIFLVSWLKGKLIELKV